MILEIQLQTQSRMHTYSAKPIYIPPPAGIIMFKQIRRHSEHFKTVYYPFRCKLLFKSIIINVHVHGSQYPEILALSFNKAIDIIYQWICLGMYFIVLAYKYISDIYISTMIWVWTFILWQ